MFIDRPCGRWVPPISGTPATRGVALATASCNAPKDRVSVRLRSHRPRPPNGCARWLPEVAIAPPFAGRGLSRRVAEHRRATLPMGRVSSASAQPALTCPGSRCLGNRLAPCRQDMDSVARNHLAACGGGRTAPKSLPPIRTTLKKGGLLLGYNPRAPGSRLKARARTSSRPSAS